VRKLVLAALVAATAAAAAVTAAPAQAQLNEVFNREDSSHLVLNAGWFDVVAGDEETVSFGAEYRHGDALLGVFKPMVAALGTAEGGFWIGAGVAVDVYLGDSVVLTGSFAPGYYEEGSGKDLGYPLEFRSQIELGYRFADYSRLTVGLSHLSNSGLWSDENPGTEIATVNYYLPLGTLFSMMD
jgi:opacity protein-like surface antigen